MAILLLYSFPMEEVLKIPQSPQTQTIEEWASSSPKQWLSNPRHISTDMDLDAEDFEFIEHPVSNSPISESPIGVNHVSLGSSEPTLSPLVEVDIVGSVGDIQTSTTELYHGAVSDSITAPDSDKWLEPHERTCPSPILTPSSSTSSLRYLRDKINLACKSVTENTPPASEILSDPYPAPQTTVTNRPRAYRVAGPWNPDGVNTGRRLQRSQLDTKFDNERGQGIPRWSPEEEIRRAQSRFRRYGKRVGTLQAEDQGVAPEVPTEEPEQVQNITLNLAKKVQWWMCLAVMLTGRVLPRLKVWVGRRKALERPVKIRLRLKKKRDQHEANHLGYIWVTDESV
jgi:hypothetical protein